MQLPRASAKKILGLDIVEKIDAFVLLCVVHISFIVFLIREQRTERDPLDEKTDL